MSDKVPLRGFQGAVLKLLRASDYQLTVTGRRELSPHYLRLSFDAGGLLTDRPLHPTMWIRMWFADGEKLHQRGYTLVDPNPEADTVDIEFALHGGVASRWAQEARPGDTIDVTVLGSNFTLPEAGPQGLCHRGRHRIATRDRLTAERDRQRTSPGVPRSRRTTTTSNCPWPAARTWCGWTERTAARRSWRRSPPGRLSPPTTSAGWRATTEPPAVAKVFRDDYKIPRKSIKAQAYWVA